MPISFHDDNVQDIIFVALRVSSVVRKIDKTTELPGNWNDFPTSHRQAVRVSNSITLEATITYHFESLVTVVKMTKNDMLGLLCLVRRSCRLDLR